MNRIFATIGLCTFGLLALLSCSGQPHANGQLKTWLEPNDKLKVLSTTAMIDDVVKRVGGQYIDSLTLIRGELDPHSYQLVKGDDEKLAYAQVIFYNGLGLEHGPSLARYLHDSDKVIALGDLIAKENPQLILKIDGQVDPHIWMDIALWLRTIPIVVQALSQHDPAHAADYLNNGLQLEREMLLTHQAVRDQMQSIPPEKRFLVTSHDAFNYFTRAYFATEQEARDDNWSHRFAAPEGLAPDSQLSSTDIQKILDHMVTYNVAVIFPESNVSRDSLRKLILSGKEKGLNVTIADVALYGDAMGHPGSEGDSYLKMIQHNADVLSKYLGNTQ